MTELNGKTGKLGKGLQNMAVVDGILVVIFVRFCCLHVEEVVVVLVCAGIHGFFITLLRIFTARLIEVVAGIMLVILIGLPCHGFGFT